MSARRTGQDPDEEKQLLFVQLFSEHQRDIKAYIRSMVPSAADADDVMQETSAILWKKLGEFDRDRDFGRWGCGVARMVVLRLRRKTATDKLWFNEELLELLSAERMTQDQPLLEARRDALRECIKTLDRTQQRYLKHRYGENLSVETIAVEVRRPVSTVYRHLAKLRKALFDCVSRRVEA